jgi:hypothetical protein
LKPKAKNHFHRRRWSESARSRGHTRITPPSREVLSARRASSPRAHGAACPERRGAWRAGQLGTRVARVPPGSSRRPGNGPLARVPATPPSGLPVVKWLISGQTVPHHWLTSGSPPRCALRGIRVLPRGTGARAHWRAGPAGPPGLERSAVGTQPSEPTRTGHAARRIKRAGGSTGSRRAAVKSGPGRPPPRGFGATRTGG